jgi:rhodanese-related sulfurtransferase
VLLELLPQVMPTLLDPDIAALLCNYLTEQGVTIRTGERVLWLEGDEQGNVRRVVGERGEVEADLVVICAGVRPRVELAREAGLAIGQTGAIAVNEYLQTSDPDIYAGGDCVENTHIVSGQKVYVPQGSTANKHGRIIGNNVTGGRESWEGIAGTTVMKLFEYNVGRTGLGEGEARALGYEVITAMVPAPDCAHFYPEHKKVILKLVADARDGRVLGAQAIGLGDAVKRIDVVATALTFRATVEQVAKLDLGYAPPFSTAIDLLAHAANVARNKRDGLAAGISPQAVREKLARGEDFVLLDVRSPKEQQGERIEDPRVVSAPLATLREHLGELLREKECVTVCALGVRSYEAQTILRGAGFEDVKFMDGGLAVWPAELATENGET